MHITPNEAAQSLAAARQAQIHTRKTTAAWAYFLVIWGVYWALPPLLHQAFPSIPSLWLWLGCTVPRYIASGIVGRRLGSRMRARVPSAFAWVFTAPVGLGAAGCGLVGRLRPWSLPGLHC